MAAWVFYFNGCKGGQVLPKVKRCSACRRRKPLHRFHKHKSGLHCYCKPCNCLKMRIWSAANKDIVSAYNRRRVIKDPLVHRRNKLRRKYNITVEQFAELNNLQNGRCAVCRRREKRRPLSVDHCHATGRVRGLLCSNCNTALGLLRDSTRVIALALQYLQLSKRAKNRHYFTMLTPA